mgnify:CR=1 FL=1
MTEQKLDNLYAYLLLRGDLPSMGRGKSQAHAMHAGNAMTHELWVKPLLAGQTVDERTLAWHAQGKGFGVTISLGKDDQVTKDRIERIVAVARSIGLLADTVRDPTYPYFVDDEIFPLLRADVHTEEPKRVRGGWICCRDEITACWIMGDKAELDVLLARFDLAPND